MVSSSANGISEKEKKTTITPEHVLAAIEQLEMTDLKIPVATFLQTLKEAKGKFSSPLQITCDTLARSSHFICRCQP